MHTPLEPESESSSGSSAPGDVTWEPPEGHSAPAWKPPAADSLWGDVQVAPDVSNQEQPQFASDGSFGAPQHSVTNQGRQMLEPSGIAKPGYGAAQARQEPLMHIPPNNQFVGTPALTDQHAYGVPTPGSMQERMGDRRSGSLQVPSVDRPVLPRAPAEREWSPHGAPSDVNDRAGHSHQGVAFLERDQSRPVLPGGQLSTPVEIHGADDSVSVQYPAYHHTRTVTQPVHPMSSSVTQDPVILDYSLPSNPQPVSFQPSYHEPPFEHQDGHQVAVREARSPDIVLEHAQQSQGEQYRAQNSLFGEEAHLITVATAQGQHPGEQLYRPMNSRIEDRDLSIRIDVPDGLGTQGVPVYSPGGSDVSKDDDKGKSAQELQSGQLNAHVMPNEDSRIHARVAAISQLPRGEPSFSDSSSTASFDRPGSGSLKVLHSTVETTEPAEQKISVPVSPQMRGLDGYSHEEAPEEILKSSLSGSDDGSGFSNSTSVHSAWEAPDIRVESLGVTLSQVRRVPASQTLGSQDLWDLPNVLVAANDSDSEVCHLDTISVFEEESESDISVRKVEPAVSHPRRLPEVGIYDVPRPIFPSPNNQAERLSETSRVELKETESSDTEARLGIDSEKGRKTGFSAMSDVAGEEKDVRPEDAIADKKIWIAPSLDFHAVSKADDGPSVDSKVDPKSLLNGKIELKSDDLNSPKKVAAESDDASKMSSKGSSPSSSEDSSSDDSSSDDSSSSSTSSSSSDSSQTTEKSSSGDSSSSGSSYKLIRQPKLPVHSSLSRPESNQNRRQESKGGGILDGPQPLVMERSDEQLRKGRVDLEKQTEEDSTSVSSAAAVAESDSSTVSTMQPELESVATDGACDLSSTSEDSDSESGASNAPLAEGIRGDFIRPMEKQTFSSFEEAGPALMQAAKGVLLSGSIPGDDESIHKTEPAQPFQSSAVIDRDCHGVPIPSLRMNDRENKSFTDSACTGKVGKEPSTTASVTDVEAGYRALAMWDTDLPTARASGIKDSLQGSSSIPKTMSDNASFGSLTWAAPIVRNDFDYIISRQQSILNAQVRPRPDPPPSNDDMERKMPQYSRRVPLIFYRSTQRKVHPITYPNILTKTSPSRKALKHKESVPEVPVSIRADGNSLSSRSRSKSNSNAFFSSERESSESISPNEPTGLDVPFDEPVVHKPVSKAEPLSNVKRVNAEGYWNEDKTSAFWEDVEAGTAMASVGKSRSVRGSGKAEEFDGSFMALTKHSSSSSSGSASAGERSDWKEDKGSSSRSTSIESGGSSSGSNVSSASTSEQSPGLAESLEKNKENPSENMKNGHSYIQEQPAIQPSPKAQPSHHGKNETLVWKPAQETEHAPSEYHVEASFNEDALFPGRKHRLRARLLCGAAVVLLVGAAVLVVLMVMREREKNGGGQVGGGAKNQTATPAPFISMEPTHAPILIPTPRPNLRPITQPSAANSDVLDLLVTALSAVGGEIGFDEPSSPQSQALQWTLSDASLETLPSTRIIQRYVLSSLWYSTMGESWARNDGWLNSEDECNAWYSSETEASICNPDGELDEIDLDTNLLAGTIPWSDLALLKDQLLILDLFTNNLTGTLSSHLGFLSSLAISDVFDNTISGTIPTEIGSMKSLVYLDMGTNFLTGTIPTQVSLLSSLESLWLENNFLSSTVPSEIGLLTNLKSLYLTNNYLTGSIPPEICSLRLKNLEVDCDVHCACCTNTNQSCSPKTEFDPLRDLLSSVSPDGGLALRTKSSPQYAALEWLRSPVHNVFLHEQTDFTENDTYSLKRIIQRYALATLYFS